VEVRSGGPKSEARSGVILVGKGFDRRKSLDWSPLRKSITLMKTWRADGHRNNALWILINIQHLWFGLSRRY
jgi:hypothetical protein